MSEPQTSLPPGLPTKPNDRPCAACRHLDSRTLLSGVAYCWRFYLWVPAAGLVVDCSGAERADGKEPPGKLWFSQGKDGSS